MKIELPQPVEKVKPRIGETVFRCNFYLPLAAKQELDKLNARLKEMKATTRLTISYALREGFTLFLKEQRRVLSLAKSGNLHAKRR